MKNYSAKIITIFIVSLIAAACCADDKRNIHSKIFEKKDKDGNAVFRMETTFRGNAKIMTTTSRPNSEGKMVVSSRSYFAGEDLVMTEADEKHDGALQTIVIYRPNTKDMEIFTREPDGSVKPVDTQILEAYKKQNVAIDQFFDKTMDKNFDEKNLPNAIEETQKKIQDTHRQITNDLVK